MNNSQDSINRQQEISPATPGNTLRRLRKDKDLSVEDVAEATKISVNNIWAIEEENYENLPADTFVRGLITLYGNFLDIDGSKIAADFLAEREKTNPAAGRQARIKKTIYSSSLTPGKLAEPSHISSATIALGLLVVIILSFTGFSLYTSWNPFSFLSQQTENMQGIFNSDTTETDVETNGEQLSYSLSAHFLQASEIVVTVDGMDPIRQTFKKNETAHWTAKDSLQVTFDKPEAATLTLNDTILPFPTAKGNQQPTLLLPDDLLDQ